MNIYKFVQGNYGNVMLTSISELWKERKYCDCTLVVDSFRIQLHKLVILAAWPSVMSSFSVTEENGHIEIYLPDFISPNALSDFVSYLYDGEIAVTPNNFETLENIAGSLSNDSLSKVCREFRKSCLDEGTQSQQKNLSKIITKLSDRHKHNLNLLNRVKSPNSFTTCKRKNDTVENQNSAKRNKRQSSETCSAMTEEEISRDSDVTNESCSGVSPQDFEIKQEPVDNDGDSDYVPENLNDCTAYQHQPFGSGRKESLNSCHGEHSQEDSTWFDKFVSEKGNNSKEDNESPKVNKRIGKKYRNYTQEMLTAAFSDVKSGKHSVLRAAKIHGVPEETLRDKIKGRRKLDCTQGRSHCFSEEEEYKILDSLEFYGRNGYKYKGVDIMRIATRFAIDFRKSIGQGEDGYDPEYTPKSQRGQKIHNRSIRGLKLTRKWFDGFYQRWSDRIDPYIIVPNKTGKLPEAPSFSEEALLSFFRTYEQALNDYNLTEQPENIYFVEDIRLLNLVIGPRDEKLQKSVSIAAVYNMAGCAFPPYFVKEAIDSDAENYFDEIAGPVNESEVITLQDHLLKCMISNADADHRILLINGDKMFVCIGIEEWALQNKIILLIVPENVSLYLRPLDVATEGNFQKQIDESYKISPSLSAADNYQMFKSIVEVQFTTMFTEERLKHTFSKTGIFPPAVSVASAVCSQYSAPVKKKNIRSGSRYKQYSQAAVNSGCDAVIHGGLSVLRASKIYGVPENTLRDFVKEKRAKMLEEDVDTVIVAGADQGTARGDDDGISEIVEKSIENFDMFKEET